VTTADQYLADLERRGFVADGAQRAALAQLGALADRLAHAQRVEGRTFRRLQVALHLAPARRRVRGLYLWGGVGRGKTLLMDLFAASLAVPVRRQHFHRFMQDVHARLRVLRETPHEDPLAGIAAEIARETRVLCFDELYVSDIADAMLLAGLFEGLVAGGVTLVFTSNTPPAGLYREGLQRSRFLPAIALIERATRVVEVDGGIDYRLRELERAPLYLEAGAAADAELGERFAVLAGAPGAADGSLEVEGREIPVRRRAEGAAWFTFDALCRGPRSTADYIELARRFHTVLVSDVPRLGTGTDDEARRFIAAVDEFYERGVKLVLSAAVPAEQLYDGERLAFEFRRTASRLVEMQTHEYLAEPHRP
jgi:cell division protein ZapE